MRLLPLTFVLLAGLACSKLGAHEHVGSSEARAVPSPAAEASAAGVTTLSSGPPAGPPPVGSASGAADAPPPPGAGPKPNFPSEFQVTAMRGVAPRGPSRGNTIQNFRDAQQKGVRYVEVDLFSSKDSVLISAHEPGVEECGIIPNMKSETLLNCQMRHGFRVASLPQILAIPFAGIYLDLKETKQAEVTERVVRSAADAVVAAHREKDVVLMMYNATEGALKIMREHGLRGGMKGYPSSPADTEKIVERAAEVGFEMVCVKAVYVTPELVTRSAELGVWHLPWSIAAYSLPHWQALAKAGAGGLIVLHYDIARKDVAPHWTDLRPGAGAHPGSAQ